MIQEPAISTKEARKRLGKRYAQLTDKQVEHLISLLNSIAKTSVFNMSSKNISF